MKIRAAIAVFAALIPVTGRTLTLEFPATATPVAERTVAQDSYFLPTAPFKVGPVEGVTAEGAIHQQSWKVGAGGLTTLQILAPLRAQLEQAGYKVLFECEARLCGGFDFRFQVDILPEPDMHVNLGDYRYLAARRTIGAVSDYVGLVVSRSANAGFVQLTQIGAPEQNTTVLTSTKAPDTGVAAAPVGTVGVQLETLGYSTLSDLTFKTGSSQLGDERFESLRNLAEYLKSRPDAQVMLVGHTDAEGALSGNIALSRKRAAAVAARLVEVYGVPRSQVSADGVGFLAPRSSNLTDSGRAQNRRVEVILTSTK